MSPMNALIGFILFFILLFLAFLAGGVAAFLHLSGQHQLLVLFAIGVIIYAAISARLWAWLNAAAKDCGGYHQLPFALLFLGALYLAYAFYETKGFLKNNLTNNCQGFCRVALIALLLTIITFLFGAWEVSLVLFVTAALAGCAAGYYSTHDSLAVPRHHTS